MSFARAKGWVIGWAFEKTSCITLDEAWSSCQKTKPDRALLAQEVVSLVCESAWLAR